MIEWEKSFGALRVRIMIPMTLVRKEVMDLAT